MKKYYRSFDGLASASITVHPDGTATLVKRCAGKKYTSRHKTEKAAKAAWYRFCN